MIRRALVALLACCALTACTPPAQKPYEPFLAEVYEGLARDYDALAARAQEQHRAVDAWCESAVTEERAAALAEARRAFADTARAWSRVEWLRRGPIADDHRYERLFYWPDRGLRGRRQLERFLAQSPAPAPIAVAELAEKSVVFQGLPALELVLFADAGVEAGCVLAVPLVASLSELTRTLAGDWRAHDSFAGAISVTDQPLSDAVAVAKVLSGAAVALEVVANDKIALPLGATPEAARPALAPLALSSLNVVTIAALVDSVHTLFAGEFQALLPEDQRYQGAGVLRELEDIEYHLNILTSAGTWQAMLADTEHRKRLTYLRQPLSSAAEGLSVGLTGALGLSPGFNATDGD